MDVKNIVFYVFTGTGNTLLAAEAAAEEFKKNGVGAEIRGMEPGCHDLPADSAICIAAPVACFSTYPTVWRFIDSLPDGCGRDAYFLGTMGGIALGMQGPLKSALVKKNYRPAGAEIVVMPGNYGREKIPLEQNGRLVPIALKKSSQFAQRIAAGKAEWRDGIFILSALMAKMARGRKPWRSFYWMYPLQADGLKCTSCGLCKNICPENNITVENSGPAKIGGRCQSCQRCMGYCPESAIGVHGKKYAQYRSVETGRLLELIKS